MAAQGFRVTGSVSRVVEGDSVPVPALEVVLHRITLTGGGPLDSSATSHDGRYQFQVASVDSGATYLVSVEHDGIGYFSEPISAPRPGDNPLGTLVVFDTSSTHPALTLAERHLIIKSSEPDGSRRVIELLVIQNRGTLTRISSDSTAPVWSGALPEDVVQFEVGQSDLSPQAIRRRGNWIEITAPMAPGEKQVLVGYILPNSLSEIVFPVDQPVLQLNLLMEDSTATIAGANLELRGVEDLDDVFFHRYGATAVAVGNDIRVEFTRQGWSPQQLVWIVVLTSALALAGSLWLWTRRPQPAPVSVLDADALATQVAVLDLEFQDRDAPTDEERQQYQQQRNALKARLTQLLRDET